MKSPPFIFISLFIIAIQIDPTKADDELNMIKFDLGSPKENLRNFKKISEDLTSFEQVYMKCVESIKDDEYTQERIDECTGKNYVKVILDVKYETMKIMSKSETKLRDFFIKHCYVHAGTNPSFSSACDILEKDILDLMWNAINFVKIVEINRSKYMYEYAEMPKKTMQVILEYLKHFSQEFFSLLNEIDSHKERAILHLKAKIEERTQVIEEESVEPDAPKPQIYHHNIHIEEELMTPEEEANNDEEIIEEPERKLPEVQIEVGSPDDFKLPARKLVKASAVNFKRRQESGVKIFNHHGKYSGLNSPNYTYKGRSLASKHVVNSVIPGLGSFADASKLRSKNVHTSYMQNRKAYRKYSK